MYLKSIVKVKLRHHTSPLKIPSNETHFRQRFYPENVGRILNLPSSFTEAPFNRETQVEFNNATTSLKLLSFIRCNTYRQVQNSSETHRAASHDVRNDAFGKGSLKSAAIT